MTARRTSAAAGLCAALALCVVVAWSTPVVARASIESTLLRCQPVYLPARAVWIRDVELVAKGGRLHEVRIDGAAVYSFSVSDSLIMTSLDNERIQIDVSERTWRSDFRGQATGQGLCDLVEPATKQP